MATAIKSEEINFLIYKYLQESGFHHSAFTFYNESVLGKTGLSTSVPIDSPPAQLVTFLQKGLLYHEMETHLNEDGSECTCKNSFSLIMPHKCTQEEKEDEDAEMVDIDVRDDEVTLLNGHGAEVFACAWNPRIDLIASGSADETARLWKIPKGRNGKISQSKKPVILRGEHNPKIPKAKNKNITTLEWNGEGTLLATGSYDGQACIWAQNGELQKKYDHNGPIFSVKWNKKGNYLCCAVGAHPQKTGPTTLIWEVATGKIKQEFQFHESTALDADWRDNKTFATCSPDMLIYVCQVGSTTPLAKFKGHTNEVNAIKWDPSGKYLASCSDDFTSKIWEVGTSSEAKQTLSGHEMAIYNIDWAPPIYSTKPRLITASLDKTIRIWNIDTGAAVFVLNRHTQAVLGISCSPNGKFLASGSFDRSLYIWSLKNGALVKSYNGDGEIFDVKWNKNSTRVAACLRNNNLAILDFKA